ncbi:MAG: hypothetical protein OEY14_17355, partial [Myxococcales bacterium]|nr:hypothetical protein [Myxococcales bacterium]
PARREPGGTVLLSTGRHRAEIRVGERHVEAAWTIRGGERGPLPIELQAQDPPEGTVAGGEPRPPLSASPEAPRVAPPTESAPLSPTLGWGLGIGGGVMTLIGAGLFALGQWDRAQVEGAAPGTEWSELAGSESRASWASGAGIALVGVGAALAAFGTYLVLRAPDEREPDTGSSELGLAIGAEGLDLLFRGSF